MNKILRGLLSLIILLIIVSLLVDYIGVEEFTESISKIGLSGLAILFIVFSVTWLIRGYKWAVILRKNGFNVPTLSATCISMFGNFINLFVPVKLGDAVWMYSIKNKHKVSGSVAFTSVIFDRMYDFTALMILALVSLLLLARMSFPDWVTPVMYIGILGVLCFFIGVVVLIVRKEFIVKLIKIKKLSKLVGKVADAFRESARNPKTTIYLLALALLVWTLQASIAYLIVLFMGVKVSFIIVLLAVCMANITQAIPVTPANIGVYEGAMAAILLVGGVPFTIGLTIALTDHLFKMPYVAVVGGLVGWMHLTDKTD